MEYRLLGRSGLKVSAFSFGAMTFGDGSGIYKTVGNTKGADARAQIARCLDMGVNLFDTADVYTSGQSEELLGEVLKPIRQQVLIATKCLARMGPGVNDLGASRKHIIEACDASLKRLGTDYIDLYQIHNQDLIVPPEETLRALDDLVRQGKVRYIGCSNFAGWQMTEALWTSRLGGLESFISCQNEYSLLERGIEAELLPAMAQYGVGLLPYYPLAGGLLTGKYAGGAAPADARLMYNSYMAGKHLSERKRAIADKLGAYANERGHSLLELSMSWLAMQPGVTSVIAGASTPAHVEANAKALDWAMSAEELAEIDKITKG